MFSAFFLTLVSVGVCTKLITFRRLKIRKRCLNFLIIDFTKEPWRHIRTNPQQSVYLKHVRAIEQHKKMFSFWLRKLSIIWALENTKTRPSWFLLRPHHFNIVRLPMSSSFLLSGHFKHQVRSILKIKWILPLVRCSRTDGKLLDVKLVRSSELWIQYEEEQWDNISKILKDDAFPFCVSFHALFTFWSFWLWGNAKPISSRASKKIL